jgi:hypothetical protein
MGSIWARVKTKLIKNSTQQPISDKAMAQRKDYFYNHYPLPKKADANAESTVNWGVANGFL